MHQCISASVHQCISASVHQCIRVQQCISASEAFAERKCCFLAYTGARRKHWHLKNMIYEQQCISASVCISASGIICLWHEEHGLGGDGLERVLDQVVQPLQVVHMHGAPLLELEHDDLRDEGDQVMRLGSCSSQPQCSHRPSKFCMASLSFSPWASMINQHPGTRSALSCSVRRS